MVNLDAFTDWFPLYLSRTTKRIRLLMGPAQSRSRPTFASTILRPSCPFSSATWICGRYQARNWSLLSLFSGSSHLSWIGAVFTPMGGLELSGITAVTYIARFLFK
ncbi:phosphopantetheinyl transferase PptB [Aspergillus luchuensis]|uniref:Phosphopantetheinyl transferase PptB n=1 Tax=Aspergillus kawachii TaxID=1069201 RepID=A0A146F430_ASPKA|nr:phosphopantetheinyl transferase PptB [Aspergillus luchuensis]